VAAIVAVQHFNEHDCTWLVYLEASCTTLRMHTGDNFSFLPFVISKIIIFKIHQIFRTKMTHPQADAPDFYFYVKCAKPLIVALPSGKGNFSSWQTSPRFSSFCSCRQRFGLCLDQTPRRRRLHLRRPEKQLPQTPHLLPPEARA
jgi:hypothetical protein